MTVVAAPVHPSTARKPIQPRHRFDVSLTGLVFVCMMMFMGLAAANSQASLLFGVFGLMIGILLVSASIPKWMLKRLEVKRDLPDQAAVGQPIALQYAIKNTKRFWPSLSVTISELDAAWGFDKQPICYLLHVAPGMTACITGEFTPIRRGLHTFNRYQLSTSFPFGFIKRAVARRQVETLLVCPPVAKVKPELMKLFKSAESYGNNLRPRTGGDDEFYGLRDYRHGENPRRIYWKRSAHMGKPVVREMTHVAPPRLLVVVDNFLYAQIPPELSLQQIRANQARIEKTIAIAASLVKSALESGLAVGLVACDQKPFSVHISRGKRHERELMNALAKLPHFNTTADREMLRNFASTSADHGTSVVICSATAGGTDPVRSRTAGSMIIDCNSRQADSWFNFENVTDFHTLKPL